MQSEKVFFENSPTLCPLAHLHEALPLHKRFPLTVLPEERQGCYAMVLPGGGGYVPNKGETHETKDANDNEISSRVPGTCQTKAYTRETPTALNYLPGHHPLL